jgi:CheY-like chemotaxis protein
VSCALHLCTSDTPVTLQVAEDNKINQKVLRMMLQANCAELTIVSDGQQAVDTYNKVRLRSTDASSRVPY